MKSAFFIHIPKTAGVSVEDMLRQNCNKGRICPAYNLHSLLDLGFPLRQYDLYFGHFPYSAIDYFPGVEFTLTFLRDPVARSISAIEHLKRDPNHPQRSKLTDFSFSVTDLLSHPKLAENFANPQTRMLGSELDIASIASALHEGTLSRKAAGAMLSQATREPVTDNTFYRACERIKRLDFVGVTERFDLCVAALADMLNLHVPSVPHLNANPAKREPLAYDPQDLAALGEANKYDAALYQVAYERSARIIADFAPNAAPAMSSESCERA